MLTLAKQGDASGMRNHLSLLAVAVAACVSCSSPPPGAPLPVSAVAGRWTADDVVLDIAESGFVTYENKRGGSRMSMSGTPMKNATTTGFDVGGFGFDSHFVINALPVEVDGVAHMTIDGIVLKKRSAAAATADAAASVDDDEAAPPGTPVPAPATLPTPATLESLVGSWEGPQMRLHVDPDGTVAYRRTGTMAKKLIGLKIANITATSFDAGLLGINTTFQLNAPPQIVDGKVTMTVDGTVLTKVTP